MEHLENNPLSDAYIREKKQDDEALLALLQKYPDNYDYMELDDEEEDIICYKKDPNRDNWKIALPDSMVNEWFVGSTSPLVILDVPE